MLSVRDSPRGANLYGSRSSAVVGSVAAHAILILLVLFAPRFVSRDRPAQATLPDLLPQNIVWLLQPGPGGGGGGGGNRMPDPPKPAKEIGTQKLTVPVAPAPTPAPIDTKPEPPQPEQHVDIPAVATAAAADTSAGAIEKGADTASLGSGSGAGAGTGTGTGIGSGQGSGLGAGFGGGTGGGGYRPGNGVTWPQLVKRVNPLYTAAAMRARVQGQVTLECIVLATGTVGNCNVTRSLDHSFGLDDEAVKAAKQWQFVPGKRLGEPVPTLVSIELTFAMH